MCNNPHVAEGRISGGVLYQGPSGCSFCGFNDGRSIGLFPKNIPHRKHLIESKDGILIETLSGGILLMRGEFVEDNVILQNIGIKESKWLVIHKHFIQNMGDILVGVVVK